jgi:hypothetical protein
MLRKMYTAGINLQVCGTCNARCGLFKNEPYFDEDVSSTMQILVSASSWIAFRLAQMPEEQIYEANGDWNQGMLSVDLPLGSKFDLTIIWDIKGKPYELTVHDVECVK